MKLRKISGNWHYGRGWSQVPRNVSAR